MKTFVLCALVGFTLSAPILRAQATATSPAPIPEEARKHFVMGATLFKDAKTPDDYAQVESQFKQAVDLAPQWPDARYNLALSKEAAGDFAGAMADLKLYQQFKLSDTDARTVQDKIYALEAKQEKKAAEQKALDDANSPAVQLAKLIKSLDGGVWRAVSDTSNMSGCATNQWVNLDVGHTYIAVSGNMISGYSFWHVITDSNGYPTQKRVNGNTLPNIVMDVPFDPNAQPLWSAALTDRKFGAPRSRLSPGSGPYSDEITISDDGQSIVESIADSGGTCYSTTTRTYTRER